MIIMWILSPHRSYIRRPIVLNEWIWSSVEVLKTERKWALMTVEHHIPRDNWDVGHLQSVFTESKLSLHTFCLNHCYPCFTLFMLQTLSRAFGTIDLIVNLWKGTCSTHGNKFSYTHTRAHTYKNPQKENTLFLIPLQYYFSMFDTLTVYLLEAL